MSTENTTPEATSPAPTILTETPSAPAVETTPQEPSSTTEPSTATTDAEPAAAADPAAQPEGNQEEGEQKPADNAALFGAPEGDYEVTLGEGQQLDAEAMTAITPLFKELGLSNEGAQKIVSAYAESVLPRMTAAVMEGVNGDVAAQQAAWADESRTLVADDAKLDAGQRVFGGQPMAAVQSVAAKALDKLGSPEFRAFLDETGLGNHPEMLKFAYRAGSAMSEDMGFERGTTPAAKPMTREEKFYGTRS